MMRKMMWRTRTMKAHMWELMCLSSILSTHHTLVVCVNDTNWLASCLIRQLAQAAFAAATGKTSKTPGSARSAKSNSLAQVQGLQKLGKYLTTTLVGARENSPRREKQQGRGSSPSLQNPLRAKTPSLRC